MPMHVTIAGGGVGAIETLIALRTLAGDRVKAVLLSPDPHVTLRAHRTVLPFGGENAPRLHLGDVAEEFGATVRRDGLESVDPERRSFRTLSGTELPYGHLVLAVGARPRIAYPDAITFGLQRRPGPFADVLREIVDRSCGCVAFVVPPGVSWTLPLYELALMTAGHAREAGSPVDLTLVTPEDAPLQLFGSGAARETATLLGGAGITFRGGVYADVTGGTVRLRPDGDELHVDRVVALPVPEGPRIAGLPMDPHGFLPVDDHMRVRGVERVHAVGDAADFPVKQGGLAAQMADVAAEELAAEAGAGITPEPFRPVLRGKLLTGRGARYLTQGLTGGTGEGEVSETGLWDPPEKVTGRYLGAWLQETGRAVPPAKEQGVEVERPLPSDRAAYTLELAPYGPLGAVSR